MLRTQPGTPIRWHCSLSGDEGNISNWKGSPGDLRRQHLALAEHVHNILVDSHVAATLPNLQLLDTDCQRTAFAIRAHDRFLLAATDTELDELIGAVAAEANHEPNRRRQQRLDAAFDTLDTVAQTNHR